MGDSSACLMQQPFCYASGFPKEANTSNPNHALGQSVSFGRFMSESLAWDKWSTFSHNRYVEEAERFTRPGSVAQKKAFFEAHYMKLAAQKAAAMLEQANNASQTQKEQEAVVGNTHNSHMTSPKSKLVLNDENAQVFNIESDATAYNSHSNRDTTFPQSNKLEGAQPKIDHQASVVKLQNQLEKGNNYKEPSEEGTKLDQDNLQSKGKNKQRVSSFKLLKIIGNLLKSTPVKSITPSLSSKDDIATPMSNKPALNSADKERSTSKPPQISFNFTLIREINRLTVSLGRKFGSTEVGASSSKASKHSSTLPRTTTKTKASKNELKNHSSFSSLTEAERNKRTSLLISTPLSLSSEAIASSRKKEKAYIMIRKLRQRICFKARSSHDIYHDREASKSGTNKDQLTSPESHKLGRRPTLSGIESKNSFPSNRPCGTLTLPLTSNSSMITTQENTSPNIHYNQNDVKF